MSFSLNAKERLALSLQFQILALLDKDNADDWDEKREIVDSGYELAYPWLYPQGGEQVSEGVCRETMNILGMYQDLRHSYEALDDKSGIEARDIHFAGFDGNSPEGHYSFHGFLSRQGKFEKSPHKNSHGPYEDAYRRMLEVFSQMNPGSNLSKAQIQQIIAARIHPENRKPKK